ncbi:MAG: nucleotide disphospho-sugar-binding domain-containing protein [Pseudomonadota bacterium]
MFRDLLGEPIGKLRMKLEMPSITDWESWLGYSNSSIGQWPRWFAEPTETWLPGVKPIGFLADGKAERVQLEPEVQQFLADNPAPALITGGTGDYLGESFFSAGLRSARQNKVPAIVVTRYPDRVPPAGSDVLITEKAPFGLLMPQCRCVIHHGGLGTLGAAAGAGIPQLILAFGADRPDNGKRASELGIGQMVEMRNWKTEQPTLLLQELLTSQSTRSGCEEIRKLTYEEQVGFPGVAELEAFGKHGIQK